MKLPVLKISRQLHVEGFTTEQARYAVLHRKNAGNNMRFVTVMACDSPIKYNVKDEAYLDLPEDAGKDLRLIGEDETHLNKAAEYLQRNVFGNRKVRLVA
jgi:hypothetical protein